MKPKLGHKDKCKQCTRTIEYIGPHWRHLDANGEPYPGLRHIAKPSLLDWENEDRDESKLIKKLKRWAEIAQLTFEKKNWDKCSLLHSFGDALARDLREAIKFIERTKITQLYQGD